MPNTKRAIILFGHGSRDPAWRRPMEAVAARIASREPALAVRCAYLELDQPDLATATAELLQAGARRFSIVPMFLGVGRHVREDLPALVLRLQTQYPEASFDLRPSVGEDERTLELLTRIATE